MLLAWCWREVTPKSWQLRQTSDQKSQSCEYPQEALGAEGAACAKALSGNQLFFLEELSKVLCAHTVGKECWPRINLSNHPVPVPFSQTRIRMLSPTCIDHSLLIPNPGLFPRSHATLPFLAAWLEYLIFSPCTTGNKSKRFIYFRYEKNWNWSCLWVDTRPKTLASGEERNFGVEISLHWWGPHNSVRHAFRTWG